MSGGSYDYLAFARDLDELLEKTYALGAMAARLAELGYAHDAAVETQNLIARLRQWEVLARVATDRLGPVWKAVEWWDSCDSSEDEVKKALKKYRGEGGCSA